MRTAFKEWAVVCRALASGRQILILRKGGLVEPGGEFQPEHREFLLFPTYLHQSAEALVADWRDVLDQVRAEQPPEGTIRIEHLAAITHSIRVTSASTSARLTSHHVWADDVIDERLRRWGTESVYALLVRVAALPEPVTLPMLPSYGGCTSWVELAQDIPTERALPVLSESEFEQRARRLLAGL